MKRAASIKDWDRMFRSITDPKMREEARCKAEREKRLDQRRKDTGL